MIIAIPSDGALYESTLNFLDVCGLRVNRENSRRYTATIPVMGGVSFLFQRGADKTGKVEDANADVGILGYDRFLEIRREDGSGCWLQFHLPSLQILKLPKGIDIQIQLSILLARLQFPI